MTATRRRDGGLRSRSRSTAATSGIPARCRGLGVEGGQIAQLEGRPAPSAATLCGPRCSARTTACWRTQLVDGRRRGRLAASGARPGVAGLLAGHVRCVGNGSRSRARGSCRGQMRSKGIDREVPEEEVEERRCLSRGYARGRGEGHGAGLRRTRRVASTRCARKSGHRPEEWGGSAGRRPRLRSACSRGRVIPVAPFLLADGGWGLAAERGLSAWPFRDRRR